MSKRPSSPPLLPAAKRPPPKTLSSWLSLPPTPLPSPIVSSSPITDRGSTFVAHAAPITSAPSALAFQSHIRSLISPLHPSPADHEILAYRTMVLMVGRTGVGEKGAEDWSVRSGMDDDGEARAGSEVKKAIEEISAVDVVVVVSRYYGGIMLGPVRFAHIKAVTLEALSMLGGALLVPVLQGLDREIEEMQGKEKGGKEGEYDELSEEKATRLVSARRKKLEFMRKRKEVEREQVEVEVVVEEEVVEEDGDEERAGLDEDVEEDIRRMLDTWTPPVVEGV